MDWNTFLKFAGILLLLIVVEKIGKWLLHEWSPGDTTVPTIILRVILFGSCLSSCGCGCRRCSDDRKKTIAIILFDYWRR
ncbi:MAG: hypothetical protein IPP40_15370 [bacterium]|nr:hypothetical protein [bacterium]